MPKDTRRPNHNPPLTFKPLSPESPLTWAYPPPNSAFWIEDLRFGGANKQHRHRQN